MSTGTRVVTVDPSDSAVGEAAALLRAGELVAFPTETVYGLGADARNKDAVAKIFTAKERPADNPLIVHIAGQHMLPDYARVIPSATHSLAKAFWPGPLTLVLPATPRMRETVCRGLDTVALRVPNHPVARALLAETGFGVAAPSANRSGRPSPTTAQHVLHDMDGRIPLILDGGNCPVGIESTVLDLSGEVATILRPGSITALQIQRVLGHPVAREGGDTSHSPGTRYRHYSPDADVFLLAESTSQETFVNFIEKTKGTIGYIGSRTVPEHAHSRVMQRNPELLATHLYADLRAYDAAGVTKIIIDLPRELPENRAVRDRLRRAAHGLVDAD